LPRSATWDEGGVEPTGWADAEAGVGFGSEQLAASQLGPETTCVEGANEEHPRGDDQVCGWTGRGGTFGV